MPTLTPEQLEGARLLYERTCAIVRERNGQTIWRDAFRVAWQEFTGERAGPQPRPRERPCPRCGRVPAGQGGEYPCPECGLPTLHDPGTCLIAAAPELIDVGRRLWSALDEVRSRDARLMNPRIRALHNELGTAIRKARGIPDPVPVGHNADDLADDPDADRDAE